ncbi:MAG: AraC family transcriptional regulator [Bacteroidetes bacterium]|nr:AraC family transcriptional regulator [Bacteroidota bacterium]
MRKNIALATLKLILLKSKTISALVGTLLLLVAFYPFFDFNTEEILLTDTSLVNNYDDSETIGNTVSSLNSNPTGACFTYTLGSKAPYPFAGIIVTGKKDFDFSSNDVITLHIKVAEKKRMQTYFSVQLTPTLQRIYGNSVECLPGIDSYELRVADYTTPLWWYKKYNVTESTLPKSDFSKVVSVCVENNLLQKQNVPDTICISSITLSKDNTFTVILLISLLVLFNAFVFFRHKLRREQKLVVEYKASEFTDVDDEKLKKQDIQQITNYISKNYENPDLTLKVMRNALGITENRISLIIRTEYQMGYKEYIHQLRINEAKRLFKDSKLNINEIATVVGFGNISTFNRVFKELEGMTASQYIEKIKA